jgi:hypothetical protein
VCCIVGIEGSDSLFRQQMSKCHIEALDTVIEDGGAESMRESHGASTEVAPQAHGYERDCHLRHIILIAMTRILWIVGLSTALLFFGGWTILIVYAGISHRHLNSKGIVMLVCNGYVAWITFRYLRQKISERKPSATH